MFVTNNILNFEALIRKSIFAFTSRLSISNNAIICTIQKSWVIRETVWKSWTDKLLVVQISCIYEHRLFYLSLYFREVDIVFFIIVYYTLYFIIYMNVNCIVTMGLVPEIKYLVSCINCTTAARHV